MDVQEFSEKNAHPKKRPGWAFFWFFCAKNTLMGVFFALKMSISGCVNLPKIHPEKANPRRHLKIVLFELAEMVYLDVLCPNLTHPALFRVEE